jgi:hypothetical protein
MHKIASSLVGLQIQIMATYRHFEQLSLRKTLVAL